MNASLAIVKATDSQVSDLDQARFAFEQLDATYKKLEAKREGLQLAMAVVEHGHHQDASEGMMAKAEPFLAYVKTYARRAAVDIEDIEVELEQLRPELNAAREKYRSHCEVEADRFAQTLIPRHRIAVAAIAKALEELTAALVNEEAIQAELVARVPQYPRSNRVPNMSAPFVGCRLDVATSTASQWARSAQGLLDR